MINEEKLKAHLWRQERINKRQEHIIKPATGHQQGNRAQTQEAPGTRQAVARAHKASAGNQQRRDRCDSGTKGGRKARRAARKKLTKTEQKVYDLMFRCHIRKSPHVWGKPQTP